MIEITSDIPAPKPSSGGRPRKYPFPDMKVGDSFSVPLTGVPHYDGGDQTANRVRHAAKHYSQLTGARFTVRTLRDEGVVRCWRVE